jgi:hypothetical protein
LPISDVGPGIPEKAIGIGLVILAEIQQYQKKKRKEKKRAISRRNDTVASGLFDAKSKNELESADILSADSSSLPVALYCG